MEGILSCVERKDIEEVHVIVKEQQGVSVEQSVFELHVLVFILFLVSLLDAIFGVVEVLIHFGRNEEVGNDAISLRHVITQTHSGLCRSAGVEDVEIPLNDIACVGVLFIDRLTAEFVPHFVVF